MPEKYHLDLDEHGKTGDGTKTDPGVIILQSYISFSSIALDSGMSHATTKFHHLQKGNNTLI